MVAPDNIVDIALELTKKAIEVTGGPAAWDALSPDERMQRNIELTTDVIHHFGQQDSDKLSREQKAKVDFCVWCGCAMHKDLNAHKGRSGMAKTAMYWDQKNKTAPIYLPNKDNKAAARLCNDAKKACIEKISSRGAIKLSRAPQFYYCDAATKIPVHLPVYWEMLELIQDEKQSGQFTNIEYNIFQALHDIPTLTELAAHALYGQSITYPYLCVARKAGMSHFELEVIHKSLLSHLKRLIKEPKLLCGLDASLDTAALDIKGWEGPEAVFAILALEPQIPDLEGVLVYLLEGALETWTRFSTDVLDQQIPSGIDPTRIYAPATNDNNESMMAGLRQEKIHVLNATLDYTNAKQQLKRQNTHTYLADKLNTPESWQYLQKRKREEEAAGGARQKRKLIVEVSKKKVGFRREKKAKRKEKKAAKDAQVKACTPLTSVLWLQEVLDAVKQSPPGPNAKEIKVSDLDLQLDWHRARQQQLGVENQA
ncbi:hypothetical protein BDP27DRAFT_1422911 [Rhodocollybia butyracea]|uniref:Uncharacterized protein n=1 Tax=Rhodocollybia butyracea TaxID=206335 RepID=A0A9P5PNZ1_9AGAR|nr:hypothetical protein BDP27DRAFT_1422911 [Rhodocollybia butyracea]